MFYFGYGSNLSPTYMALRCPSSIYLCPAFLEGYTWIIGVNGYATIHSSSPLTNQSQDEGEREKQIEKDEEDRAGSRGVWGSLYSLTAADVAILDAQENVPFSYQKSYVSVAMVSGAGAGRTGLGAGSGTREIKEDVLVYTNEKKRRAGRIGNQYAARILTGIAEAELPESYVNDVLRRWVPVREDDEDAFSDVLEVEEIQRARNGVDPHLLEGRLKGLMGLKGFAEDRQDES
ncbi:AIG2 family protein [Phlyctema vagabunda]|uniref:gamma-glutamylcyclotransferase n=1 Tax=Phlyctema vagabunda TaxID=108571 RepID=A0ABR4PQW3_9HELO